MSGVVIVTGSRIFLARGVIFDALNFHAPSLVVTGACTTGADSIAESWAKRHQVDYVGMPARWDTPEGYDKAAGHKRNQRMLEAYRGALVLAFPEGGARGTNDCIARARRLGHALIVYNSAGLILHRSPEEILQ